MPIYDYECGECQHKWDAMHPMDYKVEYCPKCGKQKVYRLISTPSMFDLKGDGFYCNDYKRKG